MKFKAILIPATAEKSQELFQTKEAAESWAKTILEAAKPGAFVNISERVETPVATFTRTDDGVKRVRI